MSSARSRSGGHPDREHVQPIEEIGAKGALLNHLLEILIGRGDHSHVHRRRAAAAAQSLNLLLLQRSEQFGLQFQRQVADFVQEQRAAVCGLKSSDRLRHRAGECASLVTEQFAFEQARRESRRSSPPRNAGAAAGRRRESPAQSLPCRSPFRRAAAPRCPRARPWRSPR